MIFSERMTPRALILVARKQVLELGNENRGLVVGTARGMRWRTEQPLTRRPEMSERLFVNNPANPFGLFTSDGKARPTARFLPHATLLFDEEYLENVSCKCWMGRNPHEASLFLAQNLKARFEKGRLVIDRVGVAKHLLKKHPGQMIGR